MHYLNHTLTMLASCGDKTYQKYTKYTKNKLPSIFTNWFTFSPMPHNYQASFASKGNLQIPSVQTASFGKNVLFVWL